MPTRPDPNRRASLGPVQILQVVLSSLEQGNVENAKGILKEVIPQWEAMEARQKAEREAQEDDEEEDPDPCLQRQEMWRRVLKVLKEERAKTEMVIEECSRPPTWRTLWLRTDAGVD
jgi:hypothetical protein